MYTALYRTERPENFDQVLGQDHIVRILKNQVKNGTVGHAYLFCGTRGTGKTSVARILAKAVNCTGFDEPELGGAAGQIDFDVADSNQSAEVNKATGKPCCKCPNCIAIQNGNFLDVIEIDAASNNGVDNVRELRESVNYPPSVGKRKVYIIDEAHELTTHALNALLKTLEEPPENVMFILATTDPQKLIQTILSRCLRLDFHRISEPELKRHMANICAKRNVEITEDALNLLTANADGSARDALSLLDQCLSGVSGADSSQPRAALDRETVLECLGTVSDDFFIKLTDSVESGDAANALLMLDGVLRDGKDVKQIMADWMGHYRSLLIGKYVAAPESILNLSAENVQKLAEQARAMSLDSINRGIMTLAETVNNARYSTQPRILMELAIVTLATGNIQDKAVNAGVKSGFSDIDSKNSFTGSGGKSDLGYGHNGTAHKMNEGAGEKVSHAQVKDEIIDENRSVKASVADSLSKDDAVMRTDAMLRDLSDIWADVWDKIDDLGSVTMVRINSTLAGINEKEFKLLIRNRVTMNIAEKNRKQLEDAMEDIVGRRLKMIIKEVDPAEQMNEGIQESLFRTVMPTDDQGGGAGQGDNQDGGAYSGDNQERGAAPTYSQGNEVDGLDQFDNQGREGDSLWDTVPEADTSKGESLSDDDLKREIENKLNVSVRIED